MNVRWLRLLKLLLNDIMTLKMCSVLVIQVDLNLLQSSWTWVEPKYYLASHIDQGWFVFIMNQFQTFWCIGFAVCIPIGLYTSPYSQSAIIFLWFYQDVFHHNRGVVVGSFSEECPPDQVPNYFWRWQYSLLPDHEKRSFRSRGSFHFLELHSLWALLCVLYQGRRMLPIIWGRGWYCFNELNKFIYGDGELHIVLSVTVSTLCMSLIALCCRYRCDLPFGNREFNLVGDSLYCSTCFTISVSVSFF